MFKRNRHEMMSFKGLMPRLFGELFGGEPDAVIIDPRGMIVISYGDVAIKYSQTGLELAVKKTGNEVYDTILRNKMDEEFKAVGEGEGVLTAKVEPEPGLYLRVMKTIQRARNEDEAVLSGIKEKKRERASRKQKSEK